MRLTLDPIKMLGPEIEGLEAVYPVIQDMHIKKMKRIQRLGELDKSTKNKPTLWLNIRGCTDLKEGDAFDRLPDPFVIATFFELDAKKKHHNLFKFKTRRLNDTCDPVPLPLPHACLYAPRMCPECVMAERACSLSPPERTTQHQRQQAACFTEPRSTHAAMS